MDWKTFTNALEWYAAAPARWYESGKKDLTAAAEWIWNVLQGDFAEEQSQAQIITGTIISLIPGVDQICDVRDLIANCKKIKEDKSNPWAWVALVLTLIGLFPELGSVAKGGCKILFAYGRKCVYRTATKTLEADFWKASQPYVEAGIGKLNQYLQMPSVRQTLSRLHIYNPYHFLSEKIRLLAAQLNTGNLLKAFDGVLNVLETLVDKIQRWGSNGFGQKAGELLESIKDIRRQATEPLRQTLAPVNQWMAQLARRLEIESDMHYRAFVNSTNPHHFARVTLEQEEANLLKAKPDWVDDTNTVPNPPRKFPPSIPQGWPDISEKSNKILLKSKYDTFHDLKPVTLKPGEKIYRVVDPKSYDDSICWMREADFKALQSRGQWRRRFAVWGSWNRNGEYVTYVVPPGEGLKVWEGPAASQRLKKKSRFIVQGGGNQIVLDPADLKLEAFGKRQPTGWGYSDYPGESDEKLGLPTLTNYMYSLEKSETP